ncbi:arylsulfatase [Filimonas lacunae]|uniref:Arylsulfatase n=1 Tax=Filimonas lacunae TaxID=477680 RepID=A0A173MI10_9BACT|nr:arylsulfatase [Filimonas lacunae]BAV07262.1 sulfatase precursor [Filimonas lacunae]SIS92349.1 arylsulfatase [Filimonas lacunae]
MAIPFHHRLFATVALLAGAYTTQAQHSPVPAFTGTVGKTLAETTAGNTQFNPAAKPGAPNIVYILLDDVGFGASSAFGGLVDTPIFDSLANNGLRYTNFHTTAICSPTRASLLTGRNHHSVNVNTVIDAAVDAPGHNGYIPFEKGTIAEIARENGYNTFAVGKWHVTPTPDISPAGPFNRWPTGRGFDHFYGFLAGETDQYTPQLWENTVKIEPDLHGKHLTTVLVDKAIEYIAGQKTAAPDKPFFLYLTPGATHGPHQVDKQWIDKYKGRFDGGWDKYREEVLAHQKQLGLVPANTTLPVRNSGVKAWDSLSAVEKKVFARFFEAYAGFLSHTDYEVGRLIHYLQEINQLNNTLVVLIIGDNGASKEGGLTGHAFGINEYIDGSVYTEKYEDRIAAINKVYDLIGSSKSGPNYPAGWAQAANTPFRYLKQDANSEGGTRNPLILFYPDGIKERGIRTQYSHVNSVTPTVIDIAHLTVPDVINGYRQDSLEGVSLAYTIANEKASDKHHVQYYEISGSRAVYKDGWKAEVYHQTGTPFTNDTWELYNLQDDFNEQHNLAATQPDKLKELQNLFDEQANKYNVYPLLGDTQGRDFSKLTKGPFDRRKQAILYPGVTQLPTRAAPFLYQHSFSIKADVEITDTRNEGVLLAAGGRFTGFTFYVQNGKLTVAHNNNGKLVYLTSDKPIAKGKAILRYDLTYIPAKNLTDEAGTESLYINDVKVAERKITKADATILPYDEGLDVGRDNASPVSPNYQTPFTFTGILHKIIVDHVIP